jgi:hypothetical protein
MCAQGMTLYRVPLFGLCFVSILLIGSLSVIAAGFRQNDLLSHELIPSVWFESVISSHDMP